MLCPIVIFIDIQNVKIVTLLLVHTFADALDSFSIKSKVFRFYKSKRTDVPPPFTKALALFTRALAYFTRALALFTKALALFTKALALFTKALALFTKALAFFTKALVLRQNSLFVNECALGKCSLNSVNLQEFNSLPLSITDISAIWYQKNTMLFIWKNVKQLVNETFFSTTPANYSKHRFGCGHGVFCKSYEYGV